NLGPVPILAVAHAPVVDYFAAEHFNEAIGNLTATVETLINNQSGFVELRAELPHQFRLPAAARIGDIDITDLAAADLVHFLAVFLDPGQVTQPRLAAQGLDQDFAGPVGRRLVVYTDK